MPSITIGPNEGVTERMQAERLISANGNIYSVSMMVPKTGLATRGRGFWAGKKHKDQDNPDVDNPSFIPAETLIERETEDGQPDGFDDDIDPMLAMRMGSHLTTITQAQTKQAKQMVDAVLGVPVKKAILTLGGTNVDLLLMDPEKLTEEQLVSSAETLKALMARSHDNYEKMALRDYASRLSKALSDVLKAKEVIAKTLPPKTSTDVEAEQQEKRKAKPPKKAQASIADAKGKTQHKYPKKGDGKGPYSDGRKPEDVARKLNKDAENDANGEVKEQKEPEPVSSPPPIDPEPLAKILKIPVQQIEKLAHSKTRQEFIKFWRKQEALLKKHSITPAYLGHLYDSLTAPEPPPPDEGEGAQQPPPQGNPQAQQQMPPMPAAKSMMVVFNSGTLNATTLALIDMLKSHKAETIEDIEKCMQSHYACTPDMATRVTRTLLNRWEREGLVTFYQKTQR